MSDLTNYQTENQYESQIQGELSSGTTVPFSLEVEDAPGLTLDSGQSVYFTIDPGTSKEETVRVDTISSTTLTVVARGRPKFNGGAATTTTHSGGAKVIISNHWEVYDDIATAVNSKIDTADGALTAYADATARDAAITSPANGMQAYLTDTGKFSDYTGGAWVARESGGTFSNGSTTVAGKFEEATVAEQGTATATGGTGARLVMANANVVKASSGAGDENKIALLSSDGKFADGFQNITEANATTLTDTSNADALHVHGTTSTMIVPMPLMGSSGVGTIALSTNTTAHAAAFSVPSKTTITKLSVRATAVGTAGVFEFAIYSEDGQTQHGAATTASIAGAGIITTALDTPVTLDAGTYWFMHVPVGTANVTFEDYTDTINSAFASVASEAVLRGSLTVTAGTLPATFDPDSDVSAAAVTMVYRLD